MSAVLLRIATLPFETLKPLRAPRASELAMRVAAIERLLAEGAADLEAALHEAAGPPDAAGTEDEVRGRLAILRVRRDVHNGRPSRKEDLRAVAARVPALEASLREREERLDERRAVEEAFARHGEGEETEARRALVEATRLPLFEEGVRLASGSLLRRVRALAAIEPEAWGHRERHVASKAASYLARFCTKTSPNGLFCATAVVSTGEAAPEVRGEAGTARVDALLSVAEARKVAAVLAADDAIAAAIVPRPNPTLRKDGEDWTFWKPTSPRHRTDEEVLSRAKGSEALATVLALAGEARLALPELVREAAARLDAEPDEARAFVAALVERGALIAEIEIPYAERRPLRFLAARCREAGCAPAWLPAIDAIEKAVDDVATLRGEPRIEAIARIERDLAALPHVRPLRPDETVRLDAASGVRMRLPDAWLREVHDSLRPYVRLFSALYPERIHREALAARFLSEHPPDADVPLLDLYHGLFEPGEEVRPSAFPDPSRLAPRGGAEGPAAAFARARAWFAERALSMRPGGEIPLDDALVTSLAGEAPEPRWSCGVLFQLAAPRPDRVRFVLSGLYHGAGLALARFAHLHGEAIVAALRRSFEPLAREGAVLAEITYNHDARTANAGLRPSIFEHEIELPGERATPGRTAIPLRDLDVRWDSAEARFRIQWRNRGVEVLPVISSGVNPVGIISFLVAVGRQGLQPVGLFPGFADPRVVRWPRVVSGRLVVFRERWVLPRTEWPASAGREFFLDLARLRDRYLLPRDVFVHTTSQPKPRYLDLDAPASADLLERTLASSGDDPEAELHVTEMLPGPDDLWIGDARGRYPFELLAPMEGGGDA